MFSCPSRVFLRVPEVSAFQKHTPSKALFQKLFSLSFLHSISSRNHCNYTFGLLLKFLASWCFLCRRKDKTSVFLVMMINKYHFWALTTSQMSQNRPTKMYFMPTFTADANSNVFTPRSELRAPGCAQEARREIQYDTRGGRGTLLGYFTLPLPVWDEPGWALGTHPIDR